jgi:murein peptide amidase A
MKHRRPLAVALAGIACGIALIVVADSLPGGAGASPGESTIATVPSPNPARPKPAKGFLDFALTPRRPGNLLKRIGVAGRSAEGRRIHLRQYGDPAIGGEVLVFGCIHGDECAARHLRPLTQITSFCSDGASDIYVVGNLNPDGFQLETRLNGRGVDLNRNFPAGWKPIGRRGSPQFSGRKPFSEPEARLAARIVDRLRPEVTIWFHQHYAPRPLVRAWGQSVPAARRFAQLAELPFRRLPWLAGTAPHWENRRFPSSSSFVVELPRGEMPEARRALLERALLHLGREVGGIGED